MSIKYIIAEYKSHLFPQVTPGRCGGGSQPCSPWNHRKASPLISLEFMVIPPYGLSWLFESHLSIASLSVSVAI